jgi:hypothetical protein
VGSGIVVLGAILHGFWYDFISDDAFIVARYARNWLGGLGPVYNPGDPVEGYTSFLGLVLTTLVGLLGVDPADGVRVVSFAGALAALIGVLVVAFRMLPEGSRGFALVAGGLVAFSGPVACWSLGGLEGPLFAALILAAAVTASRAGDRALHLALAGAVAGLAALTRPEGVAVGGILFLWLLAANPGGARRRSWIHLATFGLIVATHLAWRWSFYGDLVPNTAHAKMGLNAAAISRGLSYVVGYATDQGGVLIWLLPVLAPWPLKAPPLVRACTLAALALTGAVILEGGDGLPMYRFLAPVVPLWAISTAYLLYRVWDSVIVARPEVRRTARLAVILAVALAAFLQAEPPALRNQYGLFQHQRDVEVPRWTLVGQWLASNAPPDATIACVPIGAVGYHSGLRLIDMVGLTDRHIARRQIAVGGGWAGHEKHDGAYVLSRKPDYLLLGNIMVEPFRMPLGHPSFARPPVPGIRAREDDIFTDNLKLEYEPAIAEIAPGLFLHYFRRRES